MTSSYTKTSLIEVKAANLLTVAKTTSSVASQPAIPDQFTVISRPKARSLPAEADKEEPADKPKETIGQGPDRWEIPDYCKAILRPIWLLAAAATKRAHAPKVLETVIEVKVILPVLGLG